jgi:CTP synthase
MFCHVGKDQVLSVHDVSSVYHVPLLLKSQGIIEFLQKRLDLNTISISRPLVENGESLQSRWKALTQGYVGVSVTDMLDCLIRVTTIIQNRQERLYEPVNIVLVGKYTALRDSYMSVVKSLEHSAFRCHRKLVLQVCSAIYKQQLT